MNKKCIGIAVIGFLGAAQALAADPSGFKPSYCGQNNWVLLNQNNQVAEVFQGKVPSAKSEIVEAGGDRNAYRNDYKDAFLVKLSNGSEELFIAKNVAHGEANMVFYTLDEGPQTDLWFAVQTDVKGNPLWLQGETREAQPFGVDDIKKARSLDDSACNPTQAPAIVEAHDLIKSLLHEEAAPAEPSRPSRDNPATAAHAAN